MGKTLIICISVLLGLYLIVSNLYGEDGKKSDYQQEEICFPIYDRCALECMLDRLPEEKDKMK